MTSTNASLIEAVRQGECQLAAVPERARTPEVCLAAVQQDGWMLAYVPEALRSAELCLAAVQQHASAFEHVPEPLRTVEVCELAVQKDGWSLQWVPQSLLTAELCLAAVQQTGDALLFVPDDLRTEKLCLAAVCEDGRALKYVPESLRTADVCHAAVRQNRTAIQFVPEALRTADGNVQQSGCGQAASSRADATILTILHTACGATGVGLLNGDKPFTWDREPDSETRWATLAVVGVEAVTIDGDHWRAIDDGNSARELIRHVGEGLTLKQALDEVGRDGELEEAGGAPAKSRTSSPGM